MTRSAMRRTLVVAIAVTLPALAPALEWNGRLGVLYGRADQWTPTGDRLTEPRLDLDLGLDAGGFVYAPNFLDWSGGVQYRRLASTLGGRDEVEDQLTYRLRSTLFGDPTSPLRLDLSAARVDDGAAADGSTIGKVKSRSYAASTVLAVPDRPGLRLGYVYDELTRDVALLGTSERTLQSLSASTNHGTGSFSYAARYQGNLSRGTFASDSYDDHEVDVEASGELSAPLGAQFSTRYFLRLPRTDSEFNPRQETNSVFAALRHGVQGSPSFGRTSYSYTHALQTAPGTDDVERTANRLEYGNQRSLGREWRLVGSAGASFSDDRLSAVRQRNAGQDVSASLAWRRSAKDDEFVELRGGPTVGVLEPDGGPSQLAWGATLGGGAQRAWSALRANASYDVTWSSNLGAERGWSFRQQAVAGADRPVGAGFFRAQLLLSGERHETPLFGSGASRSATAQLEYRWHTNLLQLQAGLSDGIAGNVVGGASGDGLFLPARYDTHVRNVALLGSTTLMKRIVVTGRALYASTDLPDRPRLDEAELYASADLVYGAIRLGIEDRYVVAETPLGTGRSNQVLLRLYRTFGSR
jgi:hypothetical protein